MTLVDKLASYLENKNDFIISGSKKKTITIYCEMSTRVGLMKDVNSFLEQSGFSVSHDTNGSSSIGRLVCIDELTYYIYCKPLKSSYHKVSKGNEAKLVELINDNNINTVKFVSENYVLEYNNIKSSRMMVYPTSRKNLDGKCYKADVVLERNDGSEIPISIKCSNGSHWESADSIMKPWLKKLMTGVIDSNSLLDSWNYKNLTRDIILKTTHDMKKFVFGDDIEGKGCIVISNFEKVIINDNHATVYCSEVFDSWEQVNTHPVYKPIIVVIKNCMRNKRDPYIRGLLPMVTTQKRAKNALHITKKTPLSEFYKID